MTVKVVKTASEGISMNDLVMMSSSLDGLREVKIHDDGRYFMVFPTQILDGRNGDITSTKGYKGLPELIMAEEFTNIKPTLDREYVNYTFPEPAQRGVFEYDLNKHLFHNLHDFRELVMNDKWLEEQSPEIQELIHTSKYFTLENEKYIPLPESSLLDDDWRNGEYIKHVSGYKTEIVFYANPTTSYKLKKDDMPTNVSIYYEVTGDKEAEELGVNVGDKIETPWQEFSNFYNAMFNRIHIDPLREKFDDLQGKDFYDHPQVKKVNEGRLMGGVAYEVVSIVNRIKANATKAIEVEEGAQIPAYLSRLDVKANNFQKWFSATPGDDALSTISFACFESEIPKREGNQMHHFGQQYKDMKFVSPGIVDKHGIKEDKNPFIHSKDVTFTQRMKEECLDFPFRETYVTEDSYKFGEQLPLSAINEIIRQISIPMMNELDLNNDKHENTFDNVSRFLTNRLGVEQAVLENMKAELKGEVVSSSTPTQEEVAQAQPQVQAPAQETQPQAPATPPAATVTPPASAPAPAPQPTPTPVQVPEQQ